MTDMDKMMIEKVARAMEQEAFKLEAMAEERRILAANLLSAYNPDDRLREALERVTILLEAVMPRDGYDTSYQCRNAVKAARSALSPLPQGDG